MTVKRQMECQNVGCETELNRRVEVCSASSPQAVLSGLLPILERLLEQSGPDAPILLRGEAQLMQLTLGKYNEASAPLLVRDQAVLDVFIRALGTTAQPHPDIPSFQIIALEQVRHRRSSNPVLNVVFPPS